MRIEFQHAETASNISAKAFGSGTVAINFGQTLHVALPEPSSLSIALLTALLLLHVGRPAAISKANIA